MRLPLPLLYPGPSGRNGGAEAGDDMAIVLGGRLG